MNKGWLFLLAFLFTLTTTACADQSKALYARIGNAGSISGNYGVRDVVVHTKGGGWVNFGFGGVNGYPGASSDIGKAGIPIRIGGSWRKGRSEKGEQLIYYRIDEPIDAALAEKKMRA